MRDTGARSGMRTVLLGAAVGLAGCLSLPIRQEHAKQLTLAINTPEDARWTSTSWEAASTPAHRHVLSHARPKTVTGEVVDASCFLQLGKRGEAHILCGQKCVRTGQPIGLVTDSGHLYFVIPEEHHPRRDGEVSIRDRFAELMAKRVRVSGMVTEYRGVRTIFVRSLPNEQ